MAVRHRGPKGRWSFSSPGGVLIPILIHPPVPSAALPRARPFRSGRRAKPDGEGRGGKRPPEKNAEKAPHVLLAARTASSRGALAAWPV
jgi:hypothetical protein